MKKILALAGSNSSKSINFKFLGYVAGLIDDHAVTVLDIHDWVIPIYSQDMDESHFTPPEISELMDRIKDFDAYVIASPEHNGGPTVFFKNITDWLSRRSDKIMEDKPILLLSTSPGRRGALRSRTYYEENLHRIGGRVVASFGLPSFNHSMIDGEVIPEEREKLLVALTEFRTALEA